MHQASQSQIAEQAIQQIAHIYAVERQVKGLGSQERLRMRQEKSQANLCPRQCPLTATIRQQAGSYKDKDKTRLFPLQELACKRIFACGNAR